MRARPAFFAVMAAALCSPLAMAAAPIPASTQAEADFLLAACQDSAHNLDAVAQLATQRQWTPMQDPSTGNDEPIKVGGLWRASENGQFYTVSTATGPRGSSICQVGFSDPRPGRDDLFAAVSQSLKLTLSIDTPGPQWRSEMYRVDDLAPNNVTLQIVSSNGDVYTASFIAN